MTELKQKETETHRADGLHAAPLVLLLPDQYLAQLRTFSLSVAEREPSHRPAEGDGELAEDEMIQLSIYMIG